MPVQITIRPFKESDTSDLQRAVLSSVGHVGPWLDWCTPRYTLSVAHSWIRESMALWSGGAVFRWAIVSLDSASVHGNPILGCMEINVPVPDTPVARMGYWVARDATGRGVCTSAAMQALRWAFEHLNLARVELLIQPDNAASIAVANKLGATFHKCIEGGITFNDEPKAAKCYVVTPEALAENIAQETRRPWPLHVASNTPQSW